METINTTKREAGDVTMTGTTTFTDPINVVMNDTITKQELSQLYPVRDQAISDFLAKPNVVNNGIWATSNVANFNLSGSSVGSDLRSKALWTDKLKGFNFIRATAVYRVVINSTPFHAGCLKFGFVPFGGTNVTTPSIPSVWRSLYLSSFSTCPGTYIDCKDSTAIIKIPYVSTVDYFTIETPSDSIDWGNWYLKVYSPLNTGAASSQEVNFTVYLSFEDVELATPLHPQSSAGKKSFKRFSSKVGAVAKQEIAAQESEIMATGGSLSQGLLYAGKLASTVANIPILSSIATPVSWCLRGASTVASWFGFSKPEVDSPLTFVSRNAQPNMANATGIDGCVSLSLFHDNSIEMRPGFGAVDMDEMNFDYLKAIPAYIDSFPWTTSNLQGSVIKSYVISPKDLYQQVSVFGTSLRFFPPFAYLMTFFQVFRGSIDLHFRIVKTDFHSGKLAFAFVPYGSATTPVDSDFPYLLREIVDVKDKSEVVLRLPYLQYSKFIGVDESLGTLYVRVVNELVAPENCAQVLDVMVHASAGDDFEYAIPGMNQQIFPYTSPLIPQMGAPEVDTNQNLVSEVIGNYPSMAETTEAAAASIGEKFVSIRQLLLRYTRLCFANSSPQYGANAAFQFYPWTVNLPVASTGYTPSVTFDALTRLAHGFAFMRGSIRIGMRPSSSSNRVAIANITSLSETSTPNGVFLSNVPYNSSSGNVYTLTSRIVTGHANADTLYDSGIGFPSARIPYYCENHSTAILPTESNEVPVDVWNSYGMALINEAGATATATIDLRRSIGEDFHLGYFLGFPPLFLNVVV